MESYTCKTRREETYFAQLIGSVERARECLVDQISLGAVDSAFSALAVFEARAEELGLFLREAVQELQAESFREGQ